MTLKDVIANRILQLCEERHLTPYSLAMLCGLDKTTVYSIIGDKKYGATCNPLGRLALHASRLRFVHPVTRRDMFFETPVPAKFRYIVKGR